MAEKSEKRVPKAPKQIDFIVTTSNPKNDANNKKRVRSVAALKSWPERRKKIFEQLENSGTGQGAFVVNEPEPERQVKRVARKKAESSQSSRSDGPSAPRVPPGLPDQPRHAPMPIVFDESSRTSSYSTGGVNVEFTQAQQDDMSADSAVTLYRRTLPTLPLPALPSPDHHLHQGLIPCPCTQCRDVRRREALANEDATETTREVSRTRPKRMADGSEKVPRYSMPLLTPPASPGVGPGRGVGDPYNCYPVEYQPWYDEILHHMMTVYAPRGWPALKITKDQGIRWEWFMTQNALSEPALFYVRLLFGSGDMVRLGTMRPQYMYWLHAKAIAAMQEALQDPRRATSDAMILAVGRVALHEFMYGNKQASIRMHRPAQKHMIELRGGMRNLPFPDLVKRLMRWSDGIMAVGSDTPRMIEDDTSNPNFTLRESVSAVERWAPHEMPSVRSKINISDLINDEDDD
ncbi:hypothetical protein TI39_contig5912g00002 [Zymoseptoria brevis]|uniref:Uncharacterized protein n=1 Tax=Zymoseptoria brevis TaxID=1047168 RepID=A0A0F4G504_9PEZI|nr:hypothetical protein TI39_contig5912g00002 [Zymoseptoria brevis]